MDGNKFDFLKLSYEINNCRNILELEKVILDISGPYGVTHILSGVMPRLCSSPKEQISGVLFGKWPKEWSERYFQRQYLDLDPTIDHVRNSRSVLVWESLLEKEDFVMNEARAFGLKAGITIPMSTIDGVKVGMSFAGDRISDAPEATILFSVVSALGTNRALEINRRDSLQGDRPVRLTPAEFSCMEWIVEGKTNWEISVILGKSEKTVEKHISSCLRKLGANNRPQLIAIALRNGILN
ncbi:MAG: autoinducer binding domain-containing protein [Pseudomonadota bacterium]